MITLAIAQTLKRGQILHHISKTNRDNSPKRCRVNGAVKFWKRQPDKFRIPAKAGLYEFGYIDNDNAEDWSLPS